MDPTNAGSCPLSSVTPSWPALSRHPAPEDQLELRSGDVGEVIELTTVTTAGHQYAIRFANGYEIETVLPTRLVTFLDETPRAQHTASHRP